MVNHNTGKGVHHKEHPNPLEIRAMTRPAVSNNPGNPMKKALIPAAMIPERLERPNHALTIPGMPRVVLQEIAQPGGGKSPQEAFSSQDHKAGKMSNPPMPGKTKPRAA